MRSRGSSAAEREVPLDEAALSKAMFVEYYLPIDRSAGNRQQLTRVCEAGTRNPADVLAYLFVLNKYPAGTEELSPALDRLESITIGK